MGRLYWKANDRIIGVHAMSNSHIKSCLQILDRIDRLEIDGYSKPYWGMMFKRELNYRKELENVIMNELPFIKEELRKINY